MKILAAIVLALAATLRLQAQGYIVPNGVTSGGGSIGLGIELYVIQNPTNGDYTGFRLEAMGKSPSTALYTNTFGFGTLLDEGVRTFIVAYSQPITEQAIRSGSYTELMFSGSVVFNHGAQFYLGFYTGYSPWTSNGEYTGIYQNPVFGWAKLVNNRGVIQLLDSALAYGSGGIYVGTQNLIQVPEPGSVCLVALGGLLLGFRRRSKSP